MFPNDTFRHGRQAQRRRVEWRAHAILCHSLQALEGEDCPRRHQAAEMDVAIRLADRWRKDAESDGFVIRCWLADRFAIENDDEHGPEKVGKQ